ncbi:hypothetical protein [Psychrosphaera saromensis]|nr:hypothetical protein [Psychrosphaera saromensis]
MCVLSFFIGTAFNTYTITIDTVKSLNQLTEFALDEELQTSRLIDFYETSIEHPEKIPNHLRWSILVNYDSGQICQGQYCDQMNVNYPTLRTNKLIIEFLNKYPVEGCSALNGKQRVECNLDLLP